MLIATLLQRIGYYGPCSLDAVVREDASGELEVHWIECNGRWSGVSIPLACAIRFLGSSNPGGLVVVQEVLSEATPLSTSRLCALIDDLLFRRGVSKDGIVILSPPDRGDGVSLNAMALANSQANAEAMIGKLRQRVLAGAA